MSREVKHNSIITCDVPTGGYLDLMAIDPDTGEVGKVHQFFVPQGRHRASQWTSLLRPGEHIEVADGCVCFPARPGVTITHHPLALKSSANPDFKVTSADRMAREMRAGLAQLRNERLAIQKLARKIKADEIVVEETIPDAKPKPGPVHEPAPVEDKDKAKA